MSTYPYQSLPNFFNTGSGLADEVYLAPVRWFQAGGIAIPTPPFTNPGDKVKVLGSHAFAELEYGFVKMRLAPDKNAYEARTVGDRETQKFEHNLNIFFPGSHSLLHEQLMEMLNEPFIALHKDANCDADMYYQLGDDKNHCWLKANWNSGTTADGTKGYTCTLTWVSPSLLIYIGSFTPLPGTPDFAPEDFLAGDFKTI
jgi:hypothetical protein